LKVSLQSQYANEEGINSTNTNPAILIMPRVIYVKPGDIQTKEQLAQYYNILYLNGAYSVGNKPSKTQEAANYMQPNCSDVINGTSGTTYECSIHLKNTTSCNSDLCNNKFYIVLGTASSVSTSSSSSSAPASSSSSVPPSSSSSAPSSSSSGGGGGTSSSSTTAVTITCTINPTSYKIGENITATINCSSGNKDMSNAVFTPTGQSVKDWNQWKNNSQTYYETAGTSTYEVSGVRCNNVTAAKVTCPTLTITGPTVTCDLRGGNHNIGASISSPNLSCGDGFNVSSRNFNGSLPSNDNQWSNNGSGAYNTSGLKDNITVSGNCVSNNNNVHVPYNVSCTNPFTINAITCSISGSNNGKTSFNINENINSPQVLNCDNPNNRNYTITGGGNSDVNGGWNNNGGQVKFSSGGQKSATLNSVQCNNTNVSNLGASCGTITIAAASSSSVAASSSSTASSSSGGGSTSCITYTGGKSHCNECYNAGLQNMNGKCYKVHQDRNCAEQWLNDNAAETYWWQEVSCTGGGSTPSSSSAAPSSSSGGGGGGSCTDVAKDENFTPTANSCFNYTSTGGTAKACIDNNGPINLTVLCNGASCYSGNATACWTDFCSCSNGNTVKITVNSNTNNRSMKMNSW